MKDLSNENVIHIKENGIEYLQFRRLLEYKNQINHAYSLGINKNYRTPISYENEEEHETMLNNYKEIAIAINSDYTHTVKPMQRHTNIVNIVNEKINRKENDFLRDKESPEDGLVTNKNEIMLAATNADCILLLFYDPVKNVIANVHSGWRGTLTKIVIKTVEKMIEEYGSNPNDIICCMSPSIRKCHFEVDKDVKDMFEEEFKNFKEINLIIEEKIKDKKWNIDTVLLNEILLKNIGLKEENIIDSGICSFCESDLIHSYRAERKKQNSYGLNVALIELI